MASTQPRSQSAALNSWIRAHLFLLFAQKIRSQRPPRGPSCCTSAGMLCESDSADSWREGLGSWGGTDPVHWTGSASVVGSVEWGSSPRGHGGVGQQEGDGSVPECWVPCGEGNLPGALSLRYRSSDTFPFAAGSSSSLRFCLWKKPSWEEGQTDRSEGQTFNKFEWLKEKVSPGYEVIIVTMIKFIFTTRISCVLLILSLTLGGSKASQYRTAQSSLTHLWGDFQDIWIVFLTQNQCDDRQ